LGKTNLVLIACLGEEKEQIKRRQENVTEKLYFRRPKLPQNYFRPLGNNKSMGVMSQEPQVRNKMNVTHI
jgi:hypothetical protein